MAVRLSCRSRCVLSTVSCPTRALVDDTLKRVEARGGPGDAASRVGSAADVTFRVHATDGAARAGVLTTSRGDIRTPAFMPVGTKGTVKSLHPDEVRALGADVVLGNTYHLHFRPGEDVVEQLGGHPRLLRLERPDPHGLGRVPGLLAARHDRRARRRRRDVPLRLRRG